MPHLVGVLAGGLALALSMSLGAATAAVAAPADEMLASDDPANYTPRVLDGKVMSIARVGETVIVGGNFTTVREADVAAPELSRAGLFAFNQNTGVIDPNFAPVVASGSVDKAPIINAISLSADGSSVYVGGEFKTINGTGPARLQELRVSDGQLMTSFANGVPNRSVFDLKLVNDRLYVAGSFTSVGGTARGGLATLDATTGALTTSVTTEFTGVNNGGITTVRKIDVTPTGDRLVAIGNFSSVAGQVRKQVAILDTSGPVAALTSWVTREFADECSSVFDSYMRDVDLSPDGSFFVIGTTGGWGGTASMCDSASRWETYGSGAQDFSWVDFTGGDTFWAVEVTGPVAYVGGHFRWMNNPYTPSGGTAGAGAIAREGLAALDTRNGMPFTWNPGRTRGIGVFDFLVTPNELWAGSDTAVWSGERRDRLAAFPFADGAALPADKLGQLPGDVVQLDPDSTAGVDAKSRYLTGTGAPVTTSLTNAEDWSKARGAVMIDGKLYTGWSDGTLKARSFDGEHFGAVSNVPFSLPAFATDLPRVTSMFFDRRDGRLYYTLPNSSRKENDGGLFYRYFTPESGAVGAVRWDQSRAASVTAIDAANIGGAFLVGDQLYYVDKGGVLRKITFNGGRFTGSSSVVNNSVNWGARGVFASTAPSLSGPNVAPTSDFTVDCVGLSCTFDGGASTDSDGSIVSYTWDFGDGATAAGQSPTHTFTTADTFAVHLTVVDNRGDDASSTQQVAVAPIASSVAFRTSDAYSGGQKATHTWAVPAAVNPGDTMLLFVTGSTSAVASTPTGWTNVSDVLDTDTRTYLFSKTADAQDPGAPLEVSWTEAGVKKSAVTTMSLSAYAGVAGIGPVAAAVEESATSVNAHTTPEVTVADDGAWVLSYWSDKNASSTGWQEPAGQTVRAEPVPAVAAGAVRVTALLTDDGGPVLAGVHGGLTATSDGSAYRGSSFSVVLASS